MHLFERHEDQWVLVGRDLAVGPTDIDPESGIVRFLANGRRLGGPHDGEAYKQVYEVRRGQTVELGPNVLLNLLEVLADVRGPIARLSIHAPKHLDVMTYEDAERHRGQR